VESNTVAPSNKNESLRVIGQPVLKRFYGDPFSGTIYSYKRPYYKTVYEDGDIEQYRKSQVAPMLQKLLDFKKRMVYFFGSGVPPRYRRKQRRTNLLQKVALRACVVVWGDIF
jgi:hypothetical protein